MCGIFGVWQSGSVVGDRSTRGWMADALLQGLARLEYRGYDSAGLALEDVGIVKCSGRVSNLVSAVAAAMPANVRAQARCG